MKLNWRTVTRHSRTEWVCELLGPDDATNTWMYPIRLMLVPKEFENAKGEKHFKYTGKIKGAHTETLFNRKKFASTKEALEAVTMEFTRRVGIMLGASLRVVTGYAIVPRGTDPDNLPASLPFTHDRISQVTLADQMADDVVELQMIVLNTKKVRAE